MTQKVTIFGTQAAASFAAAREIREEVFCREQGVSAAEEWDGRDDACTHFLLSQNGVPVGTARLRPYSAGTYKIERMAVLKEHRRHGVGTSIMRAVIQFVRDANSGDAEAILHAQLTAAEFYASLGFQSEGEMFMEAGIPHVAMRLVMPAQGR